MFLKKDDLNVRDPAFAAQLFHTGDKVHIPSGADVGERRKILANQYVNGEADNNQSISGTWTVVNVGATDPGFLDGQH